MKGEFEEIIRDEPLKGPDYLVIAAMFSDKKEARIAAIEVLGEHQHVYRLGIIAKLTDSLEVAQAAVKELGKIGDTESLLDVAINTENQEIGKAIVEELSKDNIYPLIRLAKEGSGGVRETAREKLYENIEKVEVLAKGFGGAIEELREIVRAKPETVNKLNDPEVLWGLAVYPLLDVALPAVKRVSELKIDEKTKIETLEQIVRDAQRKEVAEGTAALLRMKEKDGKLMEARIKPPKRKHAPMRKPRLKLRRKRLFVR